MKIKKKTTMLVESNLKAKKRVFEKIKILCLNGFLFFFMFYLGTTLGYTISTTIRDFEYYSVLQNNACSHKRHK